MMRPMVAGSFRVNRWVKMLERFIRQSSKFIKGTVSPKSKYLGEFEDNFKMVLCYICIRGLGGFNS
jgi:hypothetical protein